MTIKNLFAALKETRKTYRRLERGTVILQRIATGCGFYATVEGCALNHIPAIDRKCYPVFSAMPPEFKRRYAFSPKDGTGEYRNRLQELSKIFRPVLTEKEYRRMRQELIKSYRRCKRLRTGQKREKAAVVGAAARL